MRGRLFLFVQSGLWGKLTLDGAEVPEPDGGSDSSRALHDVPGANVDTQL